MDRSQCAAEQKGVLQTSFFSSNVFMKTVFFSWFKIKTESFLSQQWGSLGRYQSAQGAQDQWTRTALLF